MIDDALARARDLGTRPDPPARAPSDVRARETTHVNKLAALRDIASLCRAGLCRPDQGTLEARAIAHGPSTKPVFRVAARRSAAVDVLRGRGIDA